MVDNKAPTPVHITFSGDGVTAPALRAAQEAVDVVSFCMQSMETADLAKPPEFERSRFQMKFNSQLLTAEERKIQYTNWILSKGFQDLARGIRGMLEEAHYYISFLAWISQIPEKKTTWELCEQKQLEVRKQAADLGFPDLIVAVNKGLTSPLHFEKEFLSLQKVRNCLEHRNGIVSEKDLDKGSKILKLSLPQLKIYGEKDGITTELGKGSFVEKDTAIIFKNEIHEREFKLNERITFKPEEFHDIGFGCWAFASDLGSKLPQVKAD